MLTLTYIALAVVGCGYVLMSAFLGHLGVHESGGHEGSGHVHVHHTAGEHYGIDGKGQGSTTAGHGGEAFHFPFFSPLAVSTLLAAVGSYGLIALHGFHTSAGASLLVALPAALATAYGITYAGWRLASGSKGTDVITLARLAGAPAEVTVPIPAGGLGEAVAMVSGQRYAAPAREEDGRAVPRGAPVTVIEMVGSTLVVRVGPGRRESSDSSERGSEA